MDCEDIGLPHKSHQSLVDVSPVEGFACKVICVEKDGRCMFRSLVTASISLFQFSRRDESGRPQREHDAELETCLADEFRKAVVKMMKDNLHLYSQLEQEIINANQPQLTNYLQFKDRLEDMPGDLELNAAAMVLERQIVVLDKDLKAITSYGQDQFPESSPLAIRFTRLGPDFGHYDAVILNTTDHRIPNTTIKQFVGNIKRIFGIGETKTNELLDTSGCHDNADGCTRNQSGVEEKASCHRTSSSQSTTDMRQQAEYDNDQFNDDNYMLCKSKNNKQLLRERSHHKTVDASTQTDPDVKDEDELSQ